MIKETKTNKAIRIIARWFVGLVFIFSSFTKGVDPLGTAFKVEEYMTAWSFGGITFDWALPLAPFLSMALITAEFLVGVLLITGSFRKLAAWLLLLMMAFFTFTTLYDAITNKVSDCGCFGDAIKLTNWQTFWKNVVLDIPTIFIFLTRRWPRKKSLERDTLIGIAAIAAMVVFGLYNINNEPVIDFRPWKVGNTMIKNLEAGLETTNQVTYKNIATGEIKVMDSKELMECFANDPEWGDKWEWVGTSTISPYEIIDPKNDSVVSFPVMDADGQDFTFDLIGAVDGPVMICTIHHIDDVNERGVKAIAEMKQLAMDRDIRFAVVSCAEQSELLQFLYGNNLMDVEYYFSDDKAIEAMLRSNPGFIVMQNATVRGKWHYKNVDKIKDFPFEMNND
ncbi:MAG: DoxX family protein [Bacteroidales bacterium]|nr:DoxX family protein [Bacteroidales bacterium]